MIQGPIPPDFVPPPLDWFQFALLYISFVELLALALPQRWQNQILRVLFYVKDGLSNADVSRRALFFYGTSTARTTLLLSGVNWFGIRFVLVY